MTVLALWSPVAFAQQQSVPAQSPLPSPPPATKLEAFHPSPGSVSTLAYDSLGLIQKFGVSGLIVVDLRELTSDAGDPVRGLVFTVSEGQYRKETAFVDEEEVPDLMRGLDALLSVTSNPTRLMGFERRYETKGELRLMVYSTANGGLRYGVRAGRVLYANVGTLTTADMQRLRAMIAAGQERLAALRQSP